MKKLNKKLRKRRALQSKNGKRLDHTSTDRWMQGILDRRRDFKKVVLSSDYKIDLPKGGLYREKKAYRLTVRADDEYIEPTQLKGVRLKKPSDKASIERFKRNVEQHLGITHPKCKGKK